MGIASFGAATQIRTGDLILTKDVLYQLSHSSITAYNIIAGCRRFVKSVLKIFCRIREKIRPPGKNRKEQVCKPGSVGNCHLSWRRVAASLQPPVRTVIGPIGRTYGVASDRVYSALMLP